MFSDEAQISAGGLVDLISKYTSLQRVPQIVAWMSRTTNKNGR